MRPITLLITLCAHWGAISATSDFIDSTTVYIQSIDSTSTPSPLAEIKYNPSTLDAELVEFHAPELAPSSKHVRIGVYDAAKSSWKSSTSSTSAKSFAKGYRPTIFLSLDAQGAVLGVSVKSARIDAGQTRDFGPNVVVLKMVEGKLPELNRPIVLSPEGKEAVIEPEKTLLQKYIYVILGLMNSC